MTLAVPAGSVLAERARGAGVEVIDAVRFDRGFRPARGFADARMLRRLVGQRRFDVVHTHGSQDSWATAAALLGLKPRPLVVRTRHNLFPIRDHIFNRWLYGRATDAVICISRAIQDQCAAKPYFPPERLFLVHSAVDAGPLTDAQGTPLREELGLGESLLIGVTGRLRPEKGHRFLIEAFARVGPTLPEARLLVVGDGSLAGELKALAEKLGLGERVVFTGFRRDIPRVLAALDLFVLPSISEGLGTAVLEAAAAGVPVIASDVGGVPDILGRQERGRLVPPGDAAALAEAILQWAADRAGARRRAEAAAAFVREHFSERALVEGTEAVYRRLLKVSLG